LLAFAGVFTGVATGLAATAAGLLGLTVAFEPVRVDRRVALVCARALVIGAATCGAEATGGTVVGTAAGSTEATAAVTGTVRLRATAVRSVMMADTSDALGLDVVALVAKATTPMRRTTDANVAVLSERFRSNTVFPVYECCSSILLSPNSEVRAF